MDSRDIAVLAGRIDRPIALVGLMGVGKSTVGRKLAGLMGASFVDADGEIEDAAQMSVAEIFEQFGEGYFRDGERRVIARLVEEGHGVIATGGGAFMRDDTRALMLERTIVVWIDADVPTLVQRTARRGSRPLLRQGDPHEILERLRRERTPFYAQAHVHVESRDGPHTDTALTILGAIERWL